MSRPSAESTRPLIAALAPPTDPARLRFRLLHELGHLIYHTDGNPIATEQYSSTERRAHHLAMAMLLPRHVMENQVTEHLLLQGYASLMRKFGASIFAVLDRAWHLCLIDDAQRRRLGTEACINRWHKNSPLRVQLEKPRLISDCLDRAYRNNLRTASLDLGTPEHLLAQWAGIQSDDAPVPDNVVPLRRLT